MSLDFTSRVGEFAPGLLVGQDDVAVPDVQLRIGLLDSYNYRGNF